MRKQGEGERIFHLSVTVRGKGGRGGRVSGGGKERGESQWRKGGERRKRRALRDETKGGTGHLTTKMCQKARSSEKESDVQGWKGQSMRG